MIRSYAGNEKLRRCSVARSATSHRARERTDDGGKNLSTKSAKSSKKREEERRLQQDAISALEQSMAQMQAQFLQQLEDAQKAMQRVRRRRRGTAHPLQEAASRLLLPLLQAESRIVLRWIRRERTHPDSRAREDAASVGT